MRLTGDGWFRCTDDQEEYPLVPCPHCHDYPCLCLMDDDPSDPFPESDEDDPLWPGGSAPLESEASN